MKVTVCIGSSCHIKGSRQVIEQLQHLILANDLGDSVQLCSAFCLGDCQKDVCVTVDGELCSVAPENVCEFFEKHVKAKL